MEDVHGLLPRLCASQPPLSTIKKSSSTSGSGTDGAKFDKDLFGGFTQPAQVWSLIILSNISYVGFTGIFFSAFRPFLLYARFSNSGQ